MQLSITPQPCLDIEVISVVTCNTGIYSEIKELCCGEEIMHSSDEDCVHRLCSRPAGVVSSMVRGYQRSYLRVGCQCVLHPLIVHHRAKVLQDPKHESEIDLFPSELASKSNGNTLLVNNSQFSIWSIFFGPPLSTSFGSLRWLLHRPSPSTYFLTACLCFPCFAVLFYSMGLDFEAGERVTETPSKCCRRDVVGCLFVAPVAIGSR